MLLIRRHISLPFRRRTLLLLVASVFAWFFGVFDHLSEKSFDDFRWPPYGVDVAEETARAVSAGSAGSLKAPVENDLRSFRRIVEPECEGRNGTHRLLILVKSSIYNELQRNAIRKTWGSHTDSARVVFVVGLEAEEKWATVKPAFIKELRTHGDVLHVDVLDTYRNNTLKFFHSISYAFKPDHGCPVPDFLFLVDDDYMVHVNMLLRYVAGKNASQHVPLKKYPFDRYPPYISAGAVLLSRKTVTYFYYAMQLVKLYSFDDIYAGILAYLLRIPPTHNKAFVFWSTSISAEEWQAGEVLAAHGYSYDRLFDEYSIISGVK
ncbi:N-acetyllactosaminide 3-alpha-galactosyltransferase [Ancylostoma caninum]|uniref:Hexosyltransferase n=1 Tax=Ancylostoma caninum TaxID=29170 RepID=A0A368G628_ANCCA|nr:N-acetyllactosaminide 3-alpha-galactosyltransferase [Ancylostoma caninum]